MRATTVSSNASIVPTKEDTKHGNYRWIICALLFFATTINYVDRNLMSVLKQEVLIGKLGWTEANYGDVMSWFYLAYAFMMIAAGRIIDRIGIRLGFALAIVWWSLAAMGHAISGAIVAFLVWRILLGIGEAANFPASIKTVSEWFPRSERTLATGIFNSGTNIGAIATPVAVSAILALGSWRWTFIVVGSFGFIWLLFWWAIYQKPENHPRLGRAELAYIQSEPSEQVVKVPWLPLLRFRQTWAITVAKTLTDPIWWFYLGWIPGFLNRKFGVTIAGVTLPLGIIYTMATVGSISGGLIPAFLLKRKWSLNRARKTSLLICALLVLPVVFAALTHSAWTAVFLVGLACAAHQGWSANVFTTASDMFPKQAVGSITGIAGFGGALGGWAMGRYVGRYLDAHPYNYLPLFVTGAAIYLLAFIILHLFAPKLEKAPI